MRVGRLIAEKGLHTVVAGYCASACSIMFMGGKLRTFSDTFRPAFTYVGIHGPRYKLTNELAPQLGTQLYAFYKSQMGERFNATIVRYLQFAREFNEKFPGFETDIHGLVKNGSNGDRRYYVDCVAN